ncbi:MAG: hypothetical protein ACTH3D_04150 [Halomonas sp.]|uniref:hypothetical protein n=1 Tax=Halomonas sp. TaxID=1486246 RepID=UPI003F909984
MLCPLASEVLGQLDIAEVNAAASFHRVAFETVADEPGPDVNEPSASHDYQR